MNGLVTDYFKTIHPQHKDGVRMKISLYNNISDAILRLLEREEEIPLTIFLDKVCSQFVDTLGENTGWYIYTVKVDLEARGLIRHDRRKKRTPNQSIVRLTMRGKRQSRILQSNSHSLAVSNSTFYQS